MGVVDVVEGQHGAAVEERTLRGREQTEGFERDSDVGLGTAGVEGGGQEQEGQQGKQKGPTVRSTGEREGGRAGWRGNWHGIFSVLLAVHRADAAILPCFREPFQVAPDLLLLRRSDCAIAGRR